MIASDLRFLAFGQIAGEHHRTFVCCFLTKCEGSYLGQFAAKLQNYHDAITSGFVIRVC